MLTHLLTTLDLEAKTPIVLDLQQNNNTQLDFLNVIYFFVEDEVLKTGDTLVIDNWGKHLGDKIMEPLLELCIIMEIHFCLLAKYSPELNPCKLIFALVKDKLQQHRGHAEFWIEMFEHYVLLYVTKLPSFITTLYVK
jgi:transposase